MFLLYAFTIITHIIVSVAGTDINIGAGTDITYKQPIFTTNNDENPLLVAVFMVKNEEPVICSTLKPYIEGGIQYYLIYDTGSTDNTISVTRQCFDDNNIPMHRAIIKQDIFIDFATSRNKALRATENAYPTATFMLMPDAEWKIYRVDVLLDFCRQHRSKKEKIYGIYIQTDMFFATSRLIRCRAGVEFEGVVHEIITTPITISVPTISYFKMEASAFGKAKSEARWKRDLVALLKDHAINPTNPRTLFYIAQTYSCMGDWYNATIWYKARTLIKGWDEENYMAQYRVGLSYENIGNWDQAMIEYIKAHSMRPSRVEPLVKLAKHYESVKDYALCFLFAYRASIFSSSNADMLFIERDAYSYHRHDLLGICSWYVNEYEIGKNAVLRALEAKPDDSHLKRNLKLFTDILTTASVPKGSTDKIANPSSVSTDKIVEQSISPVTNKDSSTKKRETIELDLPTTLQIIKDRIRKTSISSRPVTIAILAKDKAHTLPIYLSCIESQTWPASKTYLYIRTNNNNDQTANLLREWVDKVKDKYLGIYFNDSNVEVPVQNYGQHEWNTARFKVLGKIRQDSLIWAKEKDTDYFVVDCDNFIHHNTLEQMIQANVQIVAPLLRTADDTHPVRPGKVSALYSNYHAAIDANGYYLDSPLYHQLLNREIKSLTPVPVVHCTYLIRHTVLDKLSYDDHSNRYEYVIFSDSARKNNIPQYLDTREMYGRITFAETTIQLYSESWIDEFI